MAANETIDVAAAAVAALHAVRHRPAAVPRLPAAVRPADVTNVRTSPHAVMMTGVRVVMKIVVNAVRSVIVIAVPPEMIVVRAAMTTVVALSPTVAAETVTNVEALCRLPTRFLLELRQPVG